MNHKNVQFKKDRSYINQKYTGCCASNEYYATHGPKTELFAVQVQYGCVFLCVCDVNKRTIYTGCLYTFLIHKEKCRTTSINCSIIYTTTMQCLHSRALCFRPVRCAICFYGVISCIFVIYVSEILFKIKFKHKAYFC